MKKLELKNLKIKALSSGAKTKILGGSTMSNSADCNADSSLNYIPQDPGGMCPVGGSDDPTVIR
ncbi:hypothetical protein [Aquimarina sp. 2304DJ70-9]|uniref:hypothetical protein n=1 Tax=Aquimarina penaris TaxID=3231044 RepID=UPI00346345D8